MSTAPVRATGGAGFTYEDKVGAYLAAAMLADAHPLRGQVASSAGTVAQIDFQTSADGWLLDDALLTLQRATDTWRCAISIKSNPQFTHGRASPDFVERAWREFLGQGAKSFDPDTDRLALAAPPLSATTRADLDELQRLAFQQDPAALVGRLKTRGYVSEARQRLFASFECPSTVAVDKTEEDIVLLLRRVLVLVFDWETVPSLAHQRVLEWCRSSLVDREHDQAERLWESLLAVVSAARTAGGAVGRTDLIDGLASQFKLVHRADTSADWSALQELTAQNVSLVSDRLGGDFHLDRPLPTAKLADTVRESRFAVVLGRSGAGKSAATRAWAEGTGVPFVWLRPSDFDAQSSSVDVRLPLRHSLLDILRGFSGATGDFVIDGLDAAVDDQALQKLALVFRGLEDETSLQVWRLVVTCQTQDWPHVAERLTRLRSSAGSWPQVEVGLLTPQELATVAASFPAIMPLLEPLGSSPLRNLKVLDLVVRRATEAAAEVGRGPSESTLSTWFWEGEVLRHPDGVQRATALQLLAERQADRVETETPLQNLRVSDAARTVDELERSGICSVVEGRVSFAHDLIGDWVRHQLLLSHRDELPAYLAARSDSPVWHRAIRLFAVALLEGTDGVAAWTRAVASLEATGARILQDLFLEAPVFSGRAEELLDLVWSELVKGDGTLLRRLLTRFRHVASTPDPHLMVLFRGSAELELYGEAQNRLPVGVLWLPLLRALSRNQDTALAAAPHQLAQVADLWLRATPRDWPLRDVAARVAVSVGERMYEIKHGEHHVLIRDDIDATAYRAAIAAAQELPAEVRELVRKLAARGDDVPNLEYVERPFGGRMPTPDPWPDGPKRRIDDAFQKICLTTDALLPLIESDPDTASEVLLALLIRPPSIREPYEFSALPGETLAVEDVLGWRTALYIDGPFLAFLNKAPSVAIDTIVRLVNFASERRVEAIERETGTKPSVIVPLEAGDAVWFGDSQTYTWYRGVWAPHSIAVPLMALEQWLYLQQDAGMDVDTAINRVLEGSHTVAFAGLLVAVGCRRPPMFTANLRPLGAVVEFLRWDSQYKRMPQDYLMIAFILAPDITRRMAEAWHSLEHRKIDLETCVLAAVLNDKATHQYFEVQRTRWRERLDESDPESEWARELRHLIARFDPANYRTAQTSDGISYWAYEEPADLRTEREQLLGESSKALAFLQFPMQCRQFLDDGSPVDESAAEAFWDLVQTLTAQEIPDDLEVVSIEDVLCGGAAVLIIKYDSWLDRFPGRREWCIESLLNTVEHPPPRDPMDSLHTHTTWSWDYFCAEALPRVWVRDRANERIRSAVAMLAWPIHYSTVIALFSACAQCRRTLDHDFLRLQHYGILIAESLTAQRDVENRMQYMAHAASWNTDGGSPIQRVRSLLRQRRRAASLDRRRRRINVQRVEATQRFVKGSLEPKVPRWGEKASHPTTTASRSPRRRRQHRSEFDVHYIMSAFAWLPSFAEARNDDERSQWLEFWQQALRSLVTRLGEDISPDEEVEGTPYQSDRWIIDGIARTILEVESADQGRALWEPILAFGNSAHYWVEDFLRSWFEARLTVAAQDGVFIAEWRAMLEYVKGAPRWQVRSFHVTELRWILMGLDYFTQRVWRDADAHLIESMHSEYAEWAHEYVRYPDAAEHLVEFLKKPVARSLLEDGLEWLREAAIESDDRYWRRDELPRHLAELLDYALRIDATVLTREPTASAFRELLRRLVDLQVPLALALSDRIAGR